MKKKLAKLMHRSPNLIIDIENIYGRIDDTTKKKMDKHVHNSYMQRDKVILHMFTSCTTLRTSHNTFLETNATTYFTWFVLQKKNLSHQNFKDDHYFIKEPEKRKFDIN